MSATHIIRVHFQNPTCTNHFSVSALGDQLTSKGSKTFLGYTTASTVYFSELTLYETEGDDFQPAVVVFQASFH